MKNLDDSITDESLREAFKTFGSITSAKVITDADDKKTVSFFSLFEVRVKGGNYVFGLSFLGFRPFKW